MSKRVRIGSIALATLVTLMVCVALVASNRSATHAMAEKMNAYDVATPSMMAVSPPVDQAAPSPPIDGSSSESDAASAAADPIKVAVPRVAYKYSYAFTLPGGAISGAQRAHLALCDRLGPARCQVLAMTDKTSDGESAQASLQLRVDSGWRGVSVICCRPRSVAPAVTPMAARSRPRMSRKTWSTPLRDSTSANCSSRG